MKDFESLSDIFGDDPGHYWDDDGTELFPDLSVKPELCCRCNWYENEREKILCNLTRLDQRDEPEFQCGAFCPKKPDCV